MRVNGLALNAMQAYPDVNQVEVSRVCSVPPELKKFSQENGITMVSHSDPRRVLWRRHAIGNLCPA
jgi:diketogulonate reductase-like aldo/keto reductase